MKLVRDFTEKDDAEAFARKLISRGIPVHFAMFRGNNTFRYGGGPKTWAVWVLIDEQHEDAIKLIKGSRHKVSSPLTEEEMASFYAEIKAHNKKGIKTHIAVFIAGLLFLVGLILVIWGSNHA